MTCRHWTTACLTLVLLASCATNRDSGGGDEPSVGTNAVWLRAVYEDGQSVSMFYEVNRPNYCAMYRSQMQTSSNSAAVSNELSSDLEAGLIDEGEYNLRSCLAGKAYYEELDALYGAQRFTTTALWLGNASLPTPGSLAPGLYHSAYEEEEPEDSDGPFGGMYMELGPNPYRALAETTCTEDSPGSFGYGYPSEFGYGPITSGMLTVSAAGASAWRLTLTGGEYQMYWYSGGPGTEGDDDDSGSAVDPEVHTISVNATFEQCDIEVDGPSPMTEPEPDGR